MIALRRFIPQHWRRWPARSRPESLFGYVTSPLLEESFPEACRRLGVTPLKAPRRHWRLARSCGAPVCLPNGTQAWLKVSGLVPGASRHLFDRELEAGKIVGVPKPDVLDSARWSDDGVEWRGLLFTLAPSPTIRLDGWPIGLRTRLSDSWLDELNSALDALGRNETTICRFPPDTIAARIAARFGPDAPRHADDWQTCHGDLSYGNLTAPELLLLDWEHWGLAPRGFDAARFITSLCHNVRLARRIEQATAHDLATPSGRVAVLLACALTLERIDTGHASTKRATPLKALAERALRGNLGKH